MGSPPRGQPSGPKSCFLIPRTLDMDTHCLKVLFVFPVGQPSLFDHFYNFVIMGCIRLALFIVMLPKARLVLHSRMSDSR